MVRSAQISVALLALCTLAPFAKAQNPSLETYFNGKQVAVKVDMPGSQKGIDLRFNKPAPMNWKEYSGRIKDFGVSIHKGDIARITTFNVKGDMIELQLDGGGFGTAGDNTSTVVSTPPTPKSDYEKQLEQDIANTDDEDRKRSLQRDLDRERARRARQDAQNKSNDQIASQMRVAQVADNRARGGSRFNLRWSGSIPPDEKNPDAIVKLMADYIDFNPAPGTAPASSDAQGPPPPPPPSGYGDTSPTAQLKRGMSRADVTGLLGPGRILSQSVSPDGLHTVVMQYLANDRTAEVTFVEDVVIRFSISSQ